MSVFGSGGVLVRFDRNEIESVPIGSLVGETASVWNGFEWSKVVPVFVGELKSWDLVEVYVKVHGKFNGEFGVCDKRVVTSINHRWVMFDGKRLHTHELEPWFVLRDWRSPDGRHFYGMISSISRFVSSETTKMYTLSEQKSRCFVINDILIGE